ncbi:MAG: SdiA-regulated domain-containing protein [Balneolales bacterium]|nr:SdiA-regulated domain-containing protein [Balneolales bacterium]
MIKSTLPALVTAFILMGAIQQSDGSEPERIDALRLIDEVSLPISDPSGLTLHANEGQLWTVSDAQGGHIYRISTDGTVLSTLFYSGEDMEGITYDATTNTLWILEERRREMVQLNMLGQVLRRVSVDIGQINENDGPEGIALNTLTGHFWVANEKNPRVILELNSDFEIIKNTPINFTGSFEVTDISGLFHEPTRDELWILSDESQRIVVTDSDLYPIRSYDLDILKPEGIAVDLPNRRVYIVSDEIDALYTFELMSIINPDPVVLKEQDYDFNFWSPDEPNGAFPPNMVFLQSEMDDPLLIDLVPNPYILKESDYNTDDLPNLGFPYKLTRRTRINGLGEEGISMINTGQGRDLGAAVLALDTRGIESASVSWLGQTRTINNRVYAIRMQYRIGIEGDFIDFIHDGVPVEYRRTSPKGHSTEFSEIHLPEEAMDEPYIQIRWKFYFTGQQTGGGGRDELRLDNIKVRAIADTSTGIEEKLGIPSQIKLGQNYPNPFNPSTTISYQISEDAHVNITLYSILGRKISTIKNRVMPAGTHSVLMDADGLSSGVYIYRMTASGRTDTRKMTILK